MINQKKSILKSVVFVAVQFICLGLIFITGPVFPSNDTLLAVELLGLGLGVWAVFAMRIGNFNIAPNGELQTQQGYRVLAADGGPVLAAPGGSQEPFQTRGPLGRGPGGRHESQ